MKNYSSVLLAGAVALALSSCANNTVIRGTFQGAPNATITIGADTLKTSAKGEFKKILPVEKGQPEFYYITKDGRRVASIIAEKGDKIVVNVDTLGIAHIEGSLGSVLLQQADGAFDAFLEAFSSTSDQSKLTKLYIDYYRQCTKFVASHPYSLAVIPVLTQHIAPGAPVFSQLSDAFLFRNTADSLKTVYPESRYVKNLDAEAKRRESEYKMDALISNASQAGYPELVMTDINGQSVSLYGSKGKITLLHFWTPADPAQSRLNIETLLPLYNEFHKKGFEIYSVCITNNKADWASIIKEQKLPWINVCDGLGLSSRAIATYNLQQLPTSLLLGSDDIIEADGDLRSILKKKLK